MTEILSRNIPLQQKQAFLVHKNLLYRINDAITFIGRHHTNNFILTTPTISRFHARIKYEDGQFILYDFGSTYGTYVNDNQVKMQPLKSGDKIKLADVEVLFVDDTDEAPSRTNRKTGGLKKSQREKNNALLEKLRSQSR